MASGPCIPFARRRVYVHAHACVCARTRTRMACLQRAHISASGCPLRFPCVHRRRHHGHTARRSDHLVASTSSSVAARRHRQAGSTPFACLGLPVHCARHACSAGQAAAAAGTLAAPVPTARRRCRRSPCRATWQPNALDALWAVRELLDGDLAAPLGHLLQGGGRGARGSASRVHVGVCWVGLRGWGGAPCSFSDAILGAGRPHGTHQNGVSMGWAGGQAS